MQLSDFFGNTPIPDDLQAQQTYLKGANAEPDMGYAAFKDPRDLGQYASKINMLGIMQNLPPADLQNTVMHEYTHATQNQMDKQAWDVYNKQQAGTSTHLDDQFLDAYHKMMAPSTMPTPQINDVGYRWNNRKEAMAFGTANMNIPDSSSRSNPMPNHYDPTAATQHAILLDLAQRAQQQQRPTPQPSYIDQLMNMFRK